VIGDTYKQAKNMLLEGRWVYFTGTPCQIEGLLKYLGKDYDNLITSDIICHGVPSAMVWQTYLKSLDSAPVKNATFRDKSLGWQGYSVKIEFENGHVHKEMARDSVYMKAFLSDICLRPSCYNCSFKSIKRASDLTLADFWGINKVFPEINDDKGISLILVHTAKGAAVLESIKEQIVIKEADVVSALESNPSATKSVIKPKKRDKFMKKVNSENFEMLVRKYTKRTLIQKVKSKVKGFVKKILK
jgi:coenzyme F420-reducing hydrogenase beta subunit